MNCTENDTFLPPKARARYEGLVLLGQGGMGQVWRAFDKDLGREVALKVLRTDISLNDSNSRRLHREGQILARMRHQNIVNVYDFVEECGFAFISMELIKGKTLGQVMKEGTLPAERLVNYVAQLANALSLLHKKGILHRDIKPANIIINEKGVVKLMDFGLAKSTVTKEWTRLTGTHEMVGTPRYMAPEVLLGEGCDERSDVYQLGLVFYEALTKTFPYPERDLCELIGALTSDSLTIVAPSKIVTEADESLDEVVLKAMERDVKKRTGTARVLSKECERWLAKCNRQGPSPIEPVVIPELSKDGTNLVAPFLVALSLLIFVAFFSPWHKNREITYSRDEVGCQHVNINWKTASPIRFSMTLYELPKNKSMIRMQESERKVEHSFHMNRLRPSNRYLLQIDSEYHSIKRTFRTSQPRLLHPCYATIVDNVFWFKYGTNLSSGLTLTIILGGEETRKSQLRGSGELTITELELSNNSLLNWTLALGDKSLATGELRCAPQPLEPQVKPWKNKNSGKWKAPFIMSIIQWHGSDFVFFDRAGDLHCMSLFPKSSKMSESLLKRLFVYTPPENPERGKQPLIGGLTRAGQGETLLSSCSQGRFIIRALDLKTRSDEWQHYQSGKLNASQWNGPMGAKEWRSVIPLSMSPSISGLLRNGVYYIVCRAKRKSSLLAYHIEKQELLWQRELPLFIGGSADLQVMKPQFFNDYIVIPAYDVDTGNTYSTFQGLLYTPIEPTNEPIGIFNPRSSPALVEPYIDKERGRLWLCCDDRFYSWQSFEEGPSEHVPIPHMEKQKIKLLTPPVRYGDNHFFIINRGSGKSTVLSLCKWQTGKEAVVIDSQTFRTVGKREDRVRGILPSHEILAGRLLDGFFCFQPKTNALATWYSPELLAPLFIQSKADYDTGSIRALSLGPNEVFIVGDERGKIWTLPLKALASTKRARLLK